MPQCPVCQTRFVESKSPHCPLCGWDVQPLSLVIGLIPEVVEKEAVRLQWAKSLWHRAKHHQDQLHHAQAQLHQTQTDYQQTVARLHQALEPVPAIEHPLSIAITPETDIIHAAEAVPPIAEGFITSDLKETDRIHAAEAVPEGDRPLPAAFAPDQELMLTSEVVPEGDHLLPAVHPDPAIWAEAIPDPILTPSNPLKPADVEGVEPAPLELPPPDLEPQRAVHAPLPARSPFDDWLLLSPEPVRTFPEIQILPLPQQEPFSFESVTTSAAGRHRQTQTGLRFSQSLGEGVSLAMIVIPGGEFCMGSPETEAERDRNEGPQHSVTVPSFCISQFPITQDQWRRVASLPKINRSLSLYPADFEGDDRPVEQVTWYDCMEFCVRLSDYAGYPYRLPSEAEWEYACRAGTTTPFHFGETLSPDLANYDGNYTYGVGMSGLYRQQTTAVSTFALANAFGLFDLHGNVWEWCLDSWHGSYEDAPQDGSAWKDQEQLYRVLRGGSWYCLPGLCRSAQRHWSQPDVGGSGIGFRVVCAIG